MRHYIKNQSLFYMLGLYLLLQIPIHAQVKVIHCTHQEVCRMAKNIVSSTSQLDLKMALKVSGDSHDFDPSSKQIKNILRAKYLLMPPLSLQPWLRSIISKKEKSTNYSLPLQKHLIIKGIDQESWSHFWLNPYTYCSSWNLIKLQLEKWTAKKYHSPCPHKEISTRQKKIKKNLVHYSLIMTHDALDALIHFLNLKEKSSVLKGSDHHEEISPKTMKYLKRLIKKEQRLLWLLEDHIVVPEKIKSMSKGHKVLRIKTLDIFPSKSKDLLENLLFQLERFK